MAQDFSKKFYSRKEWQHARQMLIADRDGLCERCRAMGRYTPGVIGHHIIELTPENITNPQIAYGLSNLMLLCNECHEVIHERQTEVRAQFDENGQPLPR